MRLLFVGEERSNRALSMGVKWEDGRLAAKQLFDALNDIGIDPKQCSFTNLFERGGKTIIKNHEGLVIAMGNKVAAGLSEMKVKHISIYHPAARGKIRKKEVYTAHVKQTIIPELIK